LRAAALGGHEDLVSSLIARSADVNLYYKSRDKSVLHLRLKSEIHAVFKTLLNAGADINTDTSVQEHILVVTCKQEDPVLVELLLASSVNANLSGTKVDSATPSVAAILVDNALVIRLLLDAGANVSHAVYNTPLSETARNCKLEIVK
jgi:hypothetical protein